MSSIAPYYKAVVAFVSLLGANLTAIAANPDIAGVLPASVTGWLAMAGTTVTGTALVWLVRNQATVADAEELLNQARHRAF